MHEVQSYKDYFGNKVTVGDTIARVTYDGKIEKEYGNVNKILKTGFYIHPQTEKTTYKWELWGKFTKKID